MALQGNLHDMGVADLIQHNCQDRKRARLTIQHDGEQAVLFFDEGRVVHAALGSQSGEEVVYRILAWEQGAFSLEADIQSPGATIQRSWSGLLLEGARRLDESALDLEVNPPENDFPVKQNQTQLPTEVNRMAQQIQEVLKDLGNEVNGYVASAVVGMDGIDIAHDSTGAKIDLDAVGAQTALFAKLVDTSTGKMNAGMLEDSLLTTKNSYVLIRFLEGKQYFLSLIVDKRGASLGNLRLMSRIYAERIAKAIPR